MGAIRRLGNSGLLLGREVAFFDGATLKAVPVGGGTARTIIPGVGAFGASWASDGTIYYGGFSPGGVNSVNAAGGSPTVRVDNTVAITGFPQPVPGGRVLITKLVTPTDSGEMRLIDLSSKKSTSLGVGWMPKYLPGGYVIFARGGSLLAAPIDLKRGEFTASPVPVLEGVGATPTFAVGGGTLVLGTSRQGSGMLTPVIVTVGGRKQPLANLPPQRDFGFPRVSPDGRRVAFRVSDEKGRADIWIYALPSGPLTRLSFGGSGDDDPAWSPDGKRVSYGAVRDSTRKLYVQAADGSDEPTVLLSAVKTPWTSEWLPDGKRFVFSQDDGANYNIGIATVGRPDSARMLVATYADERRPSLSPDGRFVAYQSNESSRPEIYVRQIDGSGKWQISTQGGISPRWSRSGRAIFFRNRDSLYAADVTTGTAVTVRGTRAVLSLAGTVDAWYDVLPGDSSFMMLSANVGDAAQHRDRLLVVTNFLDELKRRFGR